MTSQPLTKIVFKIVKRRRKGIYESLHDSNYRYYLDKTIINKEKGLLAGIWVFTSISRAMKNVNHMAKKYQHDPGKLVILSGRASLVGAQHRTGGIYLVKKVLFNQELRR